MFYCPFKLFMWHWMLKKCTFIKKAVPINNCNTVFHENPSGGSRVVPCTQTDMTKLIVSHFLQFCERTQGSWGQDSSVGIATGYRLDGPGIESW
jgi:hypothetical protein